MTPPPSFHIPISTSTGYGGQGKGTVDYDFGSVFGSIKKVVEAAGDDGSDIGGQNNSNEWKQDVGERSRRIYESRGL